MPAAKATAGAPCPPGAVGGCGGAWRKQVHVLGAGRQRHRELPPSEKAE